MAGLLPSHCMLGSREEEKQEQNVPMSALQAKAAPSQQPSPRSFLLTSYRQDSGMWLHLTAWDTGKWCALVECSVILENPGPLPLRTEGTLDMRGQLAVSVTGTQLSIHQKHAYPDYTSRQLNLGTADILNQMILFCGGLSFALEGIWQHVLTPPH